MYSNQKVPTKANKNLGVITVLKAKIATKRVLKLFQNYFSDIEHVEKYSRAAPILRNNIEIMICHTQPQH